jgi:Fe-S-cluster containining protein
VQLETDLTKIKQIAEEKQAENDLFRDFLKQQDDVAIDLLVHGFTETVTPQIDCTQCGNCCKSLMINITKEETIQLSNHLHISETQLIDQYIEQSEQGQMIINTIPCHFLKGTSCSIYENRFTECREFPHLHKPHFTGRLFGTMQYYEICPIIFNVVEKLKEALYY